MIADSSLKLWLDGNDFLNSPPTTSWNDRSGNGNNCVPYGFAYTTGSGAVGNGSVIFDGTNDYGIIANSSDFDFKGNDFSIGVTVIFATNFSTVEAFFCKRTATNAGHSFNFRIDNSTTIEFIYTTDGATQKSLKFTYTFALSTKYKIDLVRQGIDLLLYVNGVYVSSQNIGTDIIFTSTENVILGALNTNGTKNNFFKGKLFDLEIYNGLALSASQILQNYNDSINTYKKPFILSPLSGILTPMGR